MSICNNTIVNQETSLKLKSIRKTKTCCNACKKKLLMTLELDGVLRYFMKKVPRYFNTRYCPPLDLDKVTLISQFFVGDTAASRKDKLKI